MDGEHTDLENLGYAQGASGLHPLSLTREASPPVVSPPLKREKRKPRPASQAVRFHKDLQPAIDALRADGVCINGFINEAIRKHLKSTSIKPLSPAPTRRRALSEEQRLKIIAINKIGGNINQTVALLHKTGTHSAVSAAADLQDALAKIYALIIGGDDVR